MARSSAEELAEPGKAGGAQDREQDREQGREQDRQAISEADAERFAASYQPSWHSSIPPRDQSTSRVSALAPPSKRASGVPMMPPGDAAASSEPTSGSEADDVGVGLRFPGDKRRGRVAGLLVVAVAAGGIGYATLKGRAPQQDASATEASTATQAAYNAAGQQSAREHSALTDAPGLPEATGGVATGGVATGGAATGTAAAPNIVRPRAPMGSLTKPGTITVTEPTQEPAAPQLASAAAGPPEPDPTAPDPTPPAPATVTPNEAPKATTPAAEIAIAASTANTPPPTDTTDAKKTAGAVIDPMDALPEPDVAATPARVQLRISVQPAQALLLVDGRRMRHPFRTTRPGGGVVKVRASAGGFESREFTLALDRDRTLAIALQPKTR